MQTLKILRYSFFDLLRSRWSLVYFLFFFVSTMALLYMSPDATKVVTSLMNITIILTPLIGTLFGVINFYNAREFVELLLAQPIKRRSIFLGMYLGVALSLSLSFLVGVIVPFLFFIHQLAASWDLLLPLLLAGVFLTLIFTAISFLIALINENRLKGFGKAIVFWLLFAFIYDGLILIILVFFEEYPLEKIALALSILNPVDLCRILIMLKLDISALMGYTGAVFNKFFGTYQGIAVSLSALMVWVVWPVLAMVKVSGKKDF